MITRQQLQLINRRNFKYPIDIAEKDYFLTVAIKVISESTLGSQLVFKGGTALHHCYLPQHRFSEDLDFTSLNPDITIESIVSTLQSTGAFIIKKQFESPSTIKIERLWYEGILAQPGSVKVEIDRKQNVLLPPVLRPYSNVWGIDIVVPTMDILEIAAEKVRATATRARYRDFYDLYLLQEHSAVDIQRAISLLQQKEIRIPVVPEQILTNWQQAQQEANDDLRSIYTTRTVSDDEITQMLARIQFEPLLPTVA